MAQHKAEKILATHYQKILVTGYICVLPLLPYKFTKSEGIKVKLSHSTTHAHDIWFIIHLLTKFNFTIVCGKGRVYGTYFI